MDRFSKTILVVIVALLAIIAVRPYASPQPVLAAPHFKYMVVTAGPNSSDVQTILQKYSEEGWELDAPIYSEQVPGFTLIFRK